MADGLSVPVTWRSKTNKTRDIEAKQRALEIGSGKVVLFTLDRSLMEEGLLASDGYQAGTESDCGQPAPGSSTASLTSKA